MGRPKGAAATGAVLGLMMVLGVAGCSDNEATTRTPTPGTATASASPSAPPTPAGPSVTFRNSAGDEVVLSVEVADDAEERGQGLMFRESLAEDAGMIFVYAEDTTIGFYMRNTTIPLSIAFITRDGVIIDIQDMQPLDEALHYAPAPYAYAVEVNQGWYGRNGIDVGDLAEVQLAATGQG